MRPRFMVFLIMLVLFAPLWGQVVEVEEQEEEPFILTTDEQGKQVRGLSRGSHKKPDRFTIRYINVSPGPSGRIEGLSSDSVMEQNLVNEFNFPSISIMVSVAAKVITKYTNQSSGKVGDKLKVMTELRQMNLNIRLSGLDANRNVISQLEGPLSLELVNSDYFVREFGREPLLTLGINPSESSYSPGQSQSAKMLDAMMVSRDMGNFLEFSNFLNLGQIASFLNPLGTLVSGVTAIFRIFSPTKNLPNQISYLTSPTEFGWIWREQEGFGIEGIHQCMALMRTHKSIKNILVRVELITDWKKFGAWIKKIDYIVPVVQYE